LVLQRFSSGLVVAHGGASSVTGHRRQDELQQVSSQPS
jgi:hypothetical protein